MRVAVLVAALAFSSAVYPPRLAEAQERPRELFQEGKKRFESGDFRGALELFQRAYAIDPHPVLAYNIARAHESLGELEGAIASFEKYLELDPDAADRGAVEQRIATLRRELDERRALEARARENERPAPVPRPERPQPSPSPSPIPWVIAGVGVAGIGVGVALGAVGRARFDAAVDERSAERALELEDEARSLALGANIAFGIGGAIALGGTIWGIVDVVQTSNASTAVQLGPGRIGLLHQF